MDALMSAFDPKRTLVAPVERKCAASPDRPSYEPWPSTLTLSASPTVTSICRVAPCDSPEALAHKGCVMACKRETTVESGGPERTGVQPEAQGE
jgi:hypothetical protein